MAFGGSAAAFHMQNTTSPMTAIEALRLTASSSLMGKHLGLPTHAYMGLSDAKCPDYQAGLESGIGAVLAALAGVNVVSGAGMLDFESCFSLEKLVLDNEICGMVRRVAGGGEAVVDGIGGERHLGTPAAGAAQPASDAEVVRRPLAATARIADSSSSIRVFGGTQPESMCSVATRR